MTTQKDLFHKSAKKTLKELASKLGLASGQFEIRTNKGGPAVTGETILHSDTLYVMLSGDFSRDRVLFRACRNRKDYCGFDNHYMPVEKLLTTEGLNSLRAIGKIPHATCTADIAQAFGLDKLPAHLVTITQ